MEANNVVTLREALIAIRDKCQNIAMGVSPLSKKFHSAEIQALNYCFRTSVAALAAPLRNCDVGTAEEQDDRMTLYCQTRKCESCPLWDNVNNGVRCEFTWAQMPYEENESEAK